MAVLNTWKIHSLVDRTGPSNLNKIGAITSVSMPVNGSVVREVAAGKSIVLLIPAAICLAALVFMKSFNSFSPQSKEVRS